MTQAVAPSLVSMLATCVRSRSWAEQDEGPYHRGSQALRRDVVEDRDGVALQLGVRIADEANAPVRDATIEIWHCDALGRYSGFPPPNDAMVVSADGAPRGQYLAGQTFLRGRQRLDAAGMVEFRTIYPGWYPGRTVHIHVMAHIAAGGGFSTRTTQLYFPDELNDRVLSLDPYGHRPGRDTTNATDQIFPTGGDAAVLEVAAQGGGYRAAICLVVPAHDAAS